MWLAHLWWWFQNTTGTHISPLQVSQGGSKEYNFWSGFGSDIGEFAIVATIIGTAVKLYQHTRCHVDGCNKFGAHPFQHYRLCRDHHPGVPDKITTKHIAKVHLLYNKNKQES